jgi:shikimate dehydrogenase
MTMGARYAVFGHPVAHSLSPRIHAMFARQTGKAMSYEAIDVAPEDFTAVLARFAAEGGRGANITLPHKQAAAELCARLSERATRAGAVNTITREGEAWVGDNTDGAGLVRDLTERHALDLRGRRTLLLGAGGAAHGVAPALLDAGIGELYIVNRNAARADALVDALGEPGRVHSRYWQDIGNLGVFDFVINATAAGRDHGTLQLPMGIATQRTLAVDLSYGEAAIPFLAWARSARCAQAIDGLGMLVEQAAESFRDWHGVLPATDEVYDELSKRALTLATGD